jgi:NAD+ synthase
MNAGYSKDVLKIDCEQEVGRICEKVRSLLGRELKRRGVVIGVSGGIDSSVTLALTVKALGKEKVLVLQMPEKHSAEETLYLSGLVADRYGVEKIHEDITSTLEAVGFYRRYADSVRMVIPGYNENWKSKIVLPNMMESKSYSLFSIVAQSPDGKEIKERLDLKAYLGIVAATNFKQRIRKMLEYYHADRLNYAVAGTPNRLEYDQGFFVKLGDGAADVKPIAHLYKSQVYQIAEYLGVPEEIRKRPPTTDTYSLSQSQDEFYFQLSYDKLDLCLYAKNNGIDASIVASVIGLTSDQVQRVFADIDTKRKATRYLHLKPQLIENVIEIENMVIRSKEQGECDKTG